MSIKEKMEPVVRALRNKGYTTHQETENYVILRPPHGATVDTIPITVCYAGRRAGCLMITDLEGETKYLRLLKKEEV